MIFQALSEVGMCRRFWVLYLSDEINVFSIRFRTAEGLSLETWRGHILYCICCEQLFGLRVIDIIKLASFSTHTFLTVEPVSKSEMLEKFNFSIQLKNSKFSQDRKLFHLEVTFSEVWLSEATIGILL